MLNSSIVIVKAKETNERNVSKIIKGDSMSYVNSNGYRFVRYKSANEVSTVICIFVTIGFHCTPDYFIQV